MSNQHPRVSIGLPVYNGQEYLPEAIEAILAQTFTDFELIISDNASTDHTRAICEQYAAQDPRIRYYREMRNRGAAWNFNRVFHLAGGEYFKWMAHDDRIAPDYLEKCVQSLDQRSELVLCSTAVQHIDGSGFPTEPYDIHLNTGHPSALARFRALIIDYHLCYEVFGVIRNSALRRTKIMGDFGHGDGILLEELALQGPFHERADTLFFARKHAAQSMKLYGVFKDGENDYHRYTVWFAPHKAGKLIFPSWRILVEHLRVVLSARLSLKERLGCLYYTAYWAGRRRRALLGDLIIGARQLFSRPATRHSNVPQMKAGPQ